MTAIGTSWRARLKSVQPGKGVAPDERGETWSTQEEQDTGQEGFGSETEEGTPGGGQGDEGSENPLPSEGGEAGGQDVPRAAASLPES